METFVQIGASRDGLDLYLNAARSHGLHSVLVETEEFLNHRKHHGFPEFDLEIAVDRPEDTACVEQALSNTLKAQAHLVLAGFEVCTPCAFALGQKWNRVPSFKYQHIQPLNKGVQRSELKATKSGVYQPIFAAISSLCEAEQAIEAVGFPCVLKPVDAGGGLGVNVLHMPSDTAQALATLQGLNNYGGTPFQGYIVEKFIEGDEISVQGFCHGGKLIVLSTCRKIICPYLDALGVRGTREAGHIASAGLRAPISSETVEGIVTDFGYETGAFHIDFILSKGSLFFLEMGFRLSGLGVAALSQQVSGVNWGEAAFAAHYSPNVAQSVIKESDLCVGQMTLTEPDQVKRAISMALTLSSLHITTHNNSKQAQASDRMRSDLSRHGNVIAKVEMTASDSAQIEECFQTIIADTGRATFQTGSHLCAE